jgi:hypothetical protein
MGMTRSIGSGWWRRWLVVALYAVAMAWVEAAVVVYLRSLADRLNPFQTNPLPELGGVDWIEPVREAATMIMLWAVSWLAGRSWRSRWGYWLVAFGVWDIFYYAFLRVSCGWPQSLLDWDILFLLPLPWWGPVIAPVLIAALMAVGGTLIIESEATGEPVWPGRLALGLNIGGILLALYVFMADTLRVAGQGTAAVRRVVPKHFDWLLFGVAVGLMSAALIDMSRQRWRRGRLPAQGPKPGSAAG